MLVAPLINPTGVAGQEVLHEVLDRHSLFFGLAVAAGVLNWEEAETCAGERPVADHALQLATRIRTQPIVVEQLRCVRADVGVQPPRAIDEEATFGGHRLSTVE